MSAEQRRGPLAGVTVIEMAGVQHGPVSFTGMILADLGARVIRIDRPRPGPRGANTAEDGPAGILGRGHESIALDLKFSAAIDIVLDLIERADVVIEGFRPGVMERLGLGPDIAMARRPALIFGRITGWGQTGPRALSVGHDINYVSLSGALDAIGVPGGKPVVPLNLIGDMGGGGLLLALGVAAALVEARASGRGQVIDAAMIDGAILQMVAVLTMAQTGDWNAQRGTNMLDGGAPFYDTYACADGRHVAVGAIEPRFFAALCDGLALGSDQIGDQMDRGRWPVVKTLIGSRFAERTQAEWLAVFADTEACVTPVVPIDEVVDDPHNQARRNIVRCDGIYQPGVSPVFDRTPGAIGRPPPRIGQDSRPLLIELGFDEAAIERHVAAGLVSEHRSEPSAGELGAGD